MSIFNNLKEKVVEYIDVNIKLLKINLIERTSNIFGYLIYVIIVLFIVLAALLFFGFGLAELFTQLVNSRTLGYFIALGVYLLILWILFASRRRIVKSFANSFIRIMTDQDDSDDKDIK
jgi:uncharacterized membrane protein